MKNYGWKFSRLFVGFLAILVFTSTCVAGSFKPDYFKTDGHMAVTYEIKGGIIDFTGNEARKGPFPFFPGGGGAKISYYDVNWNEIKHYYIENPVFSRGCYKKGGIGQKKKKRKSLGGVVKGEFLFPLGKKIEHISVSYIQDYVLQTPIWNKVTLDIKIP